MDRRLVPAVLQDACVSGEDEALAGSGPRGTVLGVWGLEVIVSEDAGIHVI